ncbi:MAG: hypothetical protein ACP5D2_00630 [Candidatus Nanoarchaeia archaeon]
MHKRGLSGLIVIILIILIVMVAVSIIWVAVLPMINNIDISDISDISIDTTSGYTFWDDVEKKACVHVARGKGELENIQVIFSINGTTDIKYFGEENIPGEGEKRVMCFPLSNKPDTISIAPVYGDGRIGEIVSSVSLNKIPISTKGSIGLTQWVDNKEEILIRNLGLLDLSDNVLVLYNENALDAREIAEYYADARDISYNQLCGIRLPVGQYATGEQVLGARKKIVEDCLCPLVDVAGCGLDKIDEIAEKSQITHLTIIKGIPPRLIGSGYNISLGWTGEWMGDFQNPSLDYHLSYMIYKEGNIFEQARNKGILPPTPYANPGNLQDMISIPSYLEEINISEDRMLAYGRVEAINTERTKQLIDRTLEAEKQGIKGNMFYSEHILDEEKIDITRDVAYLKAIDFFRELTSDTHLECVDYLKQDYPNNAWPSSCRFGINRLGRIPGESGRWGELGGNIQTAMNAGLYIGNSHGLDLEGNLENYHNAFDGFNNMLNWRINKDCEPLCKDTDNPDKCRQASKDYFKEINTDCVGVAPGFLGWQYRSWPVQYYGFWPGGWTHLSGGNGGVDKTAPIVLEQGWLADFWPWLADLFGGDTAFQNEKFSDGRYLHYGLNAKDSECILENGSVQVCEEMIAVNLRQSINLDNPLDIEETNNFTARFRYKSKTEGKIRISPYLYLENKTNASLKGTKSLNNVIDIEPTDKWDLIEVNFTLKRQDINEDMTIITKILLDVSSGLDYGEEYPRAWAKPPRGWLQLDGFEFIHNGNELSDVNISSFNADNMQTTPGDYPANVIDRLGGIAWWGSSSHLLYSGNGFNAYWGFLGGFYSGRSLGESLLHISNNAAAGIIYGDPLYKPSGARIYFKEELPMEKPRQYYFDKSDNPDVYINAFHGRDNIDKTNWKVSVCGGATIDACSGKWKIIKSWDKAVVESPIMKLQDIANISEIINSDDKNREFIIKLEVWNPDEEQDMISNYMYINFVECYSHNACGEYESCWFDNTCQNIECDSVNDCEDFDDCSKKQCIDGYCQFTRVENEEECYYCASLENPVFKGRWISGGPDVNHDGVINGTDYDYVLIFLGREDCGFENDFCNFADINRNGEVSVGDFSLISPKHGSSCNTP